MQAIFTKYLGPTNTRGSRIKAWCDAGSITVGYDHSASDPHDVAAIALRDKLGWNADPYPAMYGGGAPQRTPGVHRVYVFAADYCKL